MVGDFEKVRHRTFSCKIGTLQYIETAVLVLNGHAQFFQKGIAGCSSVCVNFDRRRQQQQKKHFRRGILLEHTKSGAPTNYQVR